MVYATRLLSYLTVRDISSTVFSLPDDVPRVTTPSKALLNWSVIHDRMPWAIVLLLGGGFALAKATDVSGLSLWLGSQLEVLDSLDPRLLVLIVCLFAAAATEVTSNVAVCSILMPVLRDLVRKYYWYKFKAKDHNVYLSCVSMLVTSGKLQ